MGCAREPRNPLPQTLPQKDSVQLWIEWAKDSTQWSMDQRKMLLEQAKREAFARTDDSLLLQNLSSISLAYTNLGDSLGFRETNGQILFISEETKAFKVLGDSHWDMASFYQSHSALDSAFYHYRKALNSFEQLQESKMADLRKAKMLYNMGRIQESYKDYLGAEASISEALRVFDDLGDSKRIYNCYNMLGIIAIGMGDGDKSLEYYKKASTFLDKLQSSEAIELQWQNQNNISSALLRMGDYGTAKTSLMGLLNTEGLFEKNVELYSLALTSLAYSIFRDEKDYKKAEQLMLNAMKINDSVGHPSDQPRVKQYYAELLAARGDTIGALAHARESHKLAMETHNNDRSLEVLRLLTNLDREHASSYANAYYELSEAINEEERGKRDKFARIRMETEEIMERNVVLSMEKQKWVGAVMGISLLGFTILIIAIQYTVNTRLKFRQKHQEANQEIYNLMLSQQGKFEEGRQLEQKRISEELHDGILGEMLGIRLILSGLNEREDPDSVERRAQILEKLREVEEEIRIISHELNHASYQNFHNFIVSMEELINDTQASSGISCSFNYDKKVNWDKLQGDIKINAYRIVQESLKNCVKHANCQNIAVSFMSDGDKLKLEVMDDGNGFDIKRGKRGIGLRNIISRVKKLDGKFDMESKKGMGTTISVQLPLEYMNSDEGWKGTELTQAMNA